MDERNVKEFLESTWEKLHKIPEPGDKTPKTCAWLAERLQEFGYDVDSDVGGGVLGLLDSGKPGPHLALRSDTDALEFYVDGEKVPYHGCCHDGHMSIVLAAAKTLAEEGIQKGKLYIVFQPGEEPNLGAKAMIETGKLQDIQEMVGLHLCPDADTPHGKVATLMMHNGLGMLNAVFTGKNSHGSLPQNGINAAEAAVLAVNAANTIRCAPDKSWSCKVTQISADRSSDNTIPDYARVAFDLRAENNEILESLTEKLKNALTCAAQAVGAGVSFDYVMDPAPSYDPDLAKTVEEAITAVLGADRCIGPCPTGGGEDFHFYSYLLGAKTAYMSVGAHVNPALHIYENTFDHEMLYAAYQILCAIAHKKLG